MLKRLTLSRCFSLVTSECKWALERECRMIQEQQGPTDAQLASLRVMGLFEGNSQAGDTAVGSPRTQIGKLIDSIQRTPLSSFSFASHILKSTFFMWELFGVILGTQLDSLLRKIALLWC